MAAAAAVLLHTQHQRVLIAVRANLDDLLKLTARGAFVPKSLPAAAPIHRLAELQGHAQRLLVHVGQHQRRHQQDHQRQHAGVPPFEQAREAVAGSCRLLRKWRERAEAKQQAVFSIHHNAGKAVLHIGSSQYGSVFITIPKLLEEEVRSLLTHLKQIVSGFIASESILAVIDGDYQTLNYQAIFEKNIVVRSAKADCDRFDANLDTILHRQPVTPENTGLHLGLPANSQELEKVFEMGKRESQNSPPDWADWSHVLPDWQKSASRNGFDVQSNASATQILDSLTRDENVIIIVAHGDHDSIYLPAPPPEGSKLTEDQVKARRYEIAANKPVVYLFCCETAVVSDLKSFAQILLDSGVAAVIAPQLKIDADEGSIKFFESLVQKGSNGHENSLTKFQAAMQQTNYREMEVFLG